MTKARFRWIPRRGKSSFTMMSLHCDNAVAKKRSVALNALLAVRPAITQEDVDMVAGDFNGATWRRKSGPEQQYDRTPEEASTNAKLLVPPGTSPMCAWWYSK